MWVGALAVHVPDDGVIFTSLGALSEKQSQGCVQRHLLKQLTSIQLRRKSLFLGKEDDFEKTQLFKG